MLVLDGENYEVGLVSLGRWTFFRNEGKVESTAVDDEAFGRVARDARTIGEHSKRPRLALVDYRGDGRADGACAYDQDRACILHIPLLPRGECRRRPLYTMVSGRSS